MKSRWIPGAALAGLAVIPGGARAFDVDHATALYLATLDPAARARSDAYFDGGLWLNAGSTLVIVVICWIVLRLGLLVALRDRMRRNGWRPWVIMMAISALFIAVLIVLDMPWSIAVDFWREREYGLMNQSFGSWLGDQAIGAALFIVIGAVLLTVINGVMRLFSQRWWLLGAGVVGLFAALGSLIAPVFIMPLFNTYSELPQGPLRNRIEAMAATQGIPTDHIWMVDESRQSDRISANVSGLGPTIRISVNDNLLKRASVAEGAAVVGHEMGHYVLHHVWWGVAYQTVLAGIELWLLSRLGPMVVALGGRRRGVRGLDDPAALPVLVGVLSLVALALSPLENTMIRRSEAAADAFGLDAAREPDGFAMAAMQLAAYRKIAPPAWEEALFYDHPSGQTRVRAAMQWKKDHVPGATEVVPPKLPAPKAP